MKRKNKTNKKSDHLEGPMLRHTPKPSPNSRTFRGPAVYSNSAPGRPARHGAAGAPHQGSDLHGGVWGSVHLGGMRKLDPHGGCCCWIPFKSKLEMGKQKHRYTLLFPTIVLFNHPRLRHCFTWNFELQDEAGDFLCVAMLCRGCPRPCDIQSNHL